MWHDLFKYTFQTFSRAIIPEPRNSNPSSRAYRIRSLIRLQTIFLVSASTHAAASYVQQAKTYPMLTFIAFATQGIGLSLQSLLVVFLEEIGMSETKRKVTVLVLGVVWIYFTMYMFLADLAASKAFQLKLVPFSVFGLAIGRRWPGWVGSWIRLARTWFFLSLWVEGGYGSFGSPASLSRRLKGVTLKLIPVFVIN